MKTRLARKKAFHWSADCPRSTAGLYFTPDGHGHDFELEAYFEGSVDPETGMILNMSEVDRILSEVVAPPQPEKVRTTGALAQYLFKEILNKINASAVSLVKVRLYEHEDLWVDVWNA